MTIVTIVTQIPGCGPELNVFGDSGEKIKFSGAQKRENSSLCVTCVTFLDFTLFLEHYIYKLVTIVTMSEDMFYKAIFLLMGLWGGRKSDDVENGFRHLSSLFHPISNLLLLLAIFFNEVKLC